jgi:hypothetical protein
MVGKRTAVKAPAPAFGDGPPRGRRHLDPMHHRGHDGRTNPMRMDETIHWAAYGAPWIIAFVVMPLAMIAIRLLFGYNLGTLALGVFLLLLAGSLLAVAVNSEAMPRRPWVRRRVTVTVPWIFLVLALHLVLTGAVHYQFLYAGPDAWWRMDLRVLGGELFTGAVLALWWTLGALPAVKGDGSDVHPDGGTDRLAEALGIGTTTVRAKVQEDGPRRLIPLKLKGATLDGLRSATDLIAVAAGVGRTNLRMVEDPEDASKVDLVMMTHDVLRKMPPPPPPSHPGGSVTDPCDIGLREDNSHVFTVRVTSGGGQHVLTGGKTGSGKTESWMNGEIYELATRVDGILLHSDVRKLGATFPDIAPAFARVASTPSGTQKLIVGLLAVITYRMDNVGRCWTPESVDHYGNRMPAIGVTFEEFGAVAGYLNERNLREFLEAARSAGIYIKGSLQRAEGSILDTNVRAQFGEGECFAVMRDEDAAMSLNEETITAGARPEIWGPRIQDGYAGYFYRECGPFVKHPMPARSWRRSPAALREHIGTWAPRMCWGLGPEGLDRGTAEALGDAWTDLTSGADYAISHGWIRQEVDGHTLWIPPRELGDVRSERDRVTVTTSVVTPSAGGITVPTINTQNPGTDPDDDDDREDEMFNEDRRAADQAAAEELAVELDGDADMDVKEYDGPDLSDQHIDIDMEAGTPLPGGGSLSWPDKVRAAADVLDQMTQGVTRTLRTADIQDLWFSKPGVTQSVRPSLTRILNLLVDHGHGTDPGRGRWEIEPTAGRWLREHIGDFAESDEEDEED